jgi:hypothetical protein
MIRVHGARIVFLETLSRSEVGQHFAVVTVLRGSNDLSEVHKESTECLWQGLANSSLD